MSRHPINGPFSELFLCLVPLVGLTRAIWHVRGIPWPRRRPEFDLNHNLAGDLENELQQQFQYPGDCGAPA